MKLSVLVPLYNEDATCVGISGASMPCPSRKRSSWWTTARGSAWLSDPAAVPSVRHFAHLQNRGKGAAIRTALEQATGDVVIIQDADSEYFPEDYERLVEAYQRNTPAAPSTACATSRSVTP